MTAERKNRCLLHLPSNGLSRFGEFKAVTSYFCFSHGDITAAKPLLAFMLFHPASLRSVATGTAWVAACCCIPLFFFFFFQIVFFFPFFLELF